MKVDGIACGHIDCNRRIWNDDPDRDKWLDVHMSAPGVDFDEVAHYCPDHGRGFVAKTKFHADKRPSGQERMIDPELAAALREGMDAANERDLAKVVGRGNIPDPEPTAPITVPELPWSPAVPVVPADDRTQPIPIGELTRPMPTPGGRVRKVRARRGAATNAVTAILMLGVSVMLRRHT